MIGAGLLTIFFFGLFASRGGFIERIEDADVLALLLIGSSTKVYGLISPLISWITFANTDAAEDGVLQKWEHVFHGAELDQQRAHK